MDGTSAKRMTRQRKSAASTTAHAMRRKRRPQSLEHSRTSTEKEQLQMENKQANQPIKAEVLRSWNEITIKTWWDRDGEWLNIQQIKCRDDYFAEKTIRLTKEEAFCLREFLLATLGQ
jgi:hypothetical protein